MDVGALFNIFAKDADGFDGECVSAVSTSQ